ncbi:MAG: hypothetical protein ACYTAN_12505 [Planctomycetota bacterium]|jgi:hypothetical protein
MEEGQAVSALYVPLISATLLTISVIWLFYGWRFYWLFITLLTAMASAIVGWYFVSPHFAENLRYVPPILLGVAGGAIAIPLERVVAFVTTGALGAAIAVGVAVGFCNVPMDFHSPQLVAIAAAGFLTTGIPAALFFKFLTVVITSGYGALLAIAVGVTIAVVFTNEPLAPTATTVIIALAVWSILTTAGVIFQWKSLIVHKAQTNNT